MTNTQYANNGQLVMAVKNYEELTGEEKNTLAIPYPDKISDYANFQVRYNKQGKLLGVQAHDFSEAKKADIAKSADQPSLLDGLQVLNGNKHSKTYQLAKKHLNVTNKQINEARKVINRD